MNAPRTSRKDFLRIARPFRELFIACGITRCRRYPDGCYAVVIGRKRGPCAHSRVLAFKRFLERGLIAPSSTGR